MEGVFSFLILSQCTSAEVPSLESVSIVLEFQEVFPTDLPSMPPNIIFTFILS